MNFLFGLIPSIGFITILVLLAFRKIIPWKIAMGISATILCITVWYSANTYGPRIELPTSHLTYIPETTEITSEANLVEYQDRLGQFDNQITDEESVLGEGKVRK